MRNKDNLPEIRLRQAEESDLIFLYKLRNEPIVRRNSFQTKLINPEDHKKWFLSKLKDQNSYLYIVEVSNKPVGQVRIDLEYDTGEINIALSQEYRGFGLGTLVTKKACHLTFKKYRYVKKIVAHIKSNNLTSQRSFMKAGFIDKGKINYLGHPCRRMVLEK